jgi:hypothetical protein
VLIASVLCLCDLYVCQSFTINYNFCLIFCLLWALLHSAHHLRSLSVRPLRLPKYYYKLQFLPHFLLAHGPLRKVLIASVPCLRDLYLCQSITINYNSCLIFCLFMGPFAKCSLPPFSIFMTFIITYQNTDNHLSIMALDCGLIALCLLLLLHLQFVLNNLGTLPKLSVYLRGQTS